MGRLYGFYVLYREIPIFPGLCSAKSSQQTRLMKRDLRGGVSGGGGVLWAKARGVAGAGSKRAQTLNPTPSNSYPFPGRRRAHLKLEGWSFGVN